MGRHDPEDEALFAEEVLEPDLRSPEDQAMHVIWPGRRRPRADELILEPEPGAPEVHFADEEFEGEPPRRPLREHEPDLEEILHEQHYL